MRMRIKSKLMSNSTFGELTVTVTTNIVIRTDLQVHNFQFEPLYEQLCILILRLCCLSANAIRCTID